MHLSPPSPPVRVTFTWATPLVTGAAPSVGADADAVPLAAVVGAVVAHAAVLRATTATARPAAARSLRDIEIPP